MMLEADAAGGGKKLWPEIVIFIVVFMAASMLQSMLVTVPTIVVMFTSAEFRELVQQAAAGGIVDVTEFANSMVSHPAIMIITLFSTAATIAAAVFYCINLENRKLRTLGITKRAGSALKQAFSSLAQTMAWAS